MSKNKVADVTWLGEVPENWMNLKLKFLCKINTGSKDTQDKISDGKYPFFVRSPHVETLNEFTHDEEAIMTAGDGAGVGKVFHYYKGKFVAHQRVYIFSKFKYVSGKYLYYYLASNLKFEVLLGGAKSTVDSIRKPMLSEFPVVFPNLKNQEKITVFLDKKNNEIDNLIRIKEKSIELLKQNRQALIIETVTKGLNSNVKMKDSAIDWVGVIPKHWETKPLKYSFKIMNGKEIEIELDINDDSGINVYGSGGLFKKTNQILFEGESVLFGRKGTIGKPLYVNDSFWTVDTMYYTKFYKDSHPKWFFYLLLVYPWDMIITKTALPSVVGSDVANTVCAVPPLKEQVAIAKYLTLKDNEYFNLFNNINSQIKKLKEYRQALIYEAVTGKIDLCDIELD